MLTKKVIKYILKDRSVNKKTKVIIMLLVTAVFGGILAFVMNMIGLVIKELSFSYFSPYTNPIVNYLDTMSSGRVVVLQEQLTRFTNHLFLGNGYSYNIGETKSHNWFLDLLVQRGFIGTVIFIFCIKSIFKSSKPFYSTDKFTRAGVNMLAIMLIQGLFEITFFTISIDFLVWSMAGFLIARRRFLKTQI
jgi:O-antigen ligase